ncbi:DinB family protein [Kamptonema cortianum]|nr:DinB family protein [Geitlerinema splendidum]MDK3158645.1 DinB family protein [Kamptonema cortianum]
MTDWTLLIKALDTAHWEMGEAFKGLPDSDVWKRPHPRLLSIGEIAAHVAYWEGKSFIGSEFESPLAIEGSQYYPLVIENPITLKMGADDVYAELKRVHEASRSAFLAQPHNLEEPCPNREGWTWGMLVEYQVFHLAYHTGQMYSVRYLLGHDPVDN